MLSRARDTRTKTRARGKGERAYDLMPRDEVSRNEWARNKLHVLNVPNWGESFVWHSAAATTRDSSFSLSLPLSLSLSSNPLFSVYPRNCTTNNRSAPLPVIGRYQWRPAFPPFPLSFIREMIGDTVMLWNMRIDRNLHILFSYGQRLTIFF